MAMIKKMFTLTERNVKLLKAEAKKKGISASEFLRRMLDALDEENKEKK